MTMLPNRGTNVHDSNLPILKIIPSRNTLRQKGTTVCPRPKTMEALGR